MCSDPEFWDDGVTCRQTWGEKHKKQRRGLSTWALTNLSCLTQKLPSAQAAQLASTNTSWGFTPFQEGTVGQQMQAKWQRDTVQSRGLARSGHSRAELPRYGDSTQRASQSPEEGPWSHQERDLQECDAWAASERWVKGLAPSKQRGGKWGPGQRRQLREVKAGRQARSDSQHGRSSPPDLIGVELRKCLRKRDNHTDKDGQERGWDGTTVVTQKATGLELTRTLFSIKISIISNMKLKFKGEKKTELKTYLLLKNKQVQENKVRQSIPHTQEDPSNFEIDHSQVLT